jgi:hypothetical protein
MRRIHARGSHLHANRQSKAHGEWRSKYWNLCVCLHRALPPVCTDAWENKHHRILTKS